MLQSPDNRPPIACPGDVPHAAARSETFTFCREVSTMENTRRFL
jgi:hypothetical protein